MRLAAGGGAFLADAVGALSYALDITEGEAPGHALCSCLIGMRIAEEVGLDAGTRSALFYALLLKDAGCSSNAARVAGLYGADDGPAKRAAKRADLTKPGSAGLYALRTVEPGRGPVRKARRMIALARAGPFAQELFETRCERGADIARMLALPDGAAQAIRCLDEHWDGGGYPDGLAGTDIPLLARIAGLAQVLAVHVVEDGLDAALDVARHRAGRWFDPALVQVAEALRSDAALWGSLRADDLADRVARHEPRGHAIKAGEGDLDRVAEAFARVIDAKSPFTARHSERVAGLAVGIAATMGLGPAEQRDLRRAGLLHDLGKLAISNRILDKPGRLTEAEFAAVREHPRHTQAILEQADCFRGLTETAAAHHERLDGTGYHRGLRGDELAVPARILATADVFEALTADRPYRPPMPTDAALALMREDAGRHLCSLTLDALTAWAAEDARPLAA